MNGKQAKMLRKMKRSDQKSKRLFRSLPHYVRGHIRWLHRTNVKLVDRDFLGEVTGNYEKSVHAPVS